MSQTSHTLACPHHVRTRSSADTGAQQISVHGKDAESVPTALSPSRTPQKAGLEHPPRMPAWPTDPAEGTHVPQPDPTQRHPEKTASLWLPARKPGRGPLRIQQPLNDALFHTRSRHRESKHPEEAIRCLPPNPRSTGRWGLLGRCHQGTGQRGR